MAIVTAQGAGGRSLLVKLYGRDAWDGQLLASAWSALWYRGDAPHLALGRRAQVEHEAFVTLLAERAGSRCSRWWRPGWPRSATRCW